jgi:hypothetical protein
MAPGRIPLPLDFHSNPAAPSTAPRTSFLPIGSTPVCPDTLLSSRSARLPSFRSASMAGANARSRVVERTSSFAQK